jgi:hypothetical protein
MLPNLEKAKDVLVGLYDDKLTLINLSSYLEKKENLTAAHLRWGKIYLLALAIFDTAITMGSFAAVAPYAPISAVWLIGSGALFGIIKTCYRDLNDNGLPDLLHALACLTPTGKMLFMSQDLGLSIVKGIAVYLLCAYVPYLTVPAAGLYLLFESFTMGTAYTTLIHHEISYQRQRSHFERS